MDENDPLKVANKPLRGKPFAKGGDPRQSKGGRPKLTPEAREAKAKAQAIIDAATPAAAKAAVEMLKHRDFRARHAAGSSLLDRAGLKGVLEVRLEVTNQLAAVLDRLTERFASRPELLDEILETIAGGHVEDESA